MRLIDGAVLSAGLDRAVLLIPCHPCREFLLGLVMERFAWQAACSMLRRAGLVFVDLVHCNRSKYKPILCH